MNGVNARQRIKEIVAWGGQVVEIDAGSHHFQFFQPRTRPEQLDERVFVDPHGSCELNALETSHVLHAVTVREAVQRASTKDSVLIEDEVGQEWDQREHFVQHRIKSECGLQ